MIGRSSFEGQRASSPSTQTNSLKMTNNSMSPDLKKDKSSPKNSLNLTKQNNSLSLPELDTTSHNRSTTTTGAGLANKIGQAMSRIISSSTGIPEQVEADEDIADLIQLIDELNQSTDLTVKFKTNSKIIKYLVDASKDTSSDKGQIY